MCEGCVSGGGARERTCEELLACAHRFWHPPNAPVRPRPVFGREDEQSRQECPVATVLLEQQQRVWRRRRCSALCAAVQTYVLAAAAWRLAAVLHAEAGRSGGDPTAHWGGVQPPAPPLLEL